jgi:penicillin-binding protein activator
MHRPASSSFTARQRLGLITVSLFLSGCAATQSPFLGSGKIEYGDTKTVEAVTTDLGSTDVQIIAETMTESLIRSRAVQRAIQRGDVLMASPIQNRTSEYFDTRLITDTILTQLQRNGVRYTIESADMQNQVDELRRQNQTGLYDRSKSVRMGRMEGARYRLDGSIASIVKRDSSMKDVYYKMNLRLIDIESGIVEWSDEKDIRKTQRR